MPIFGAVSVTDRPSGQEPAARFFEKSSDKNLHEVLRARNERVPVSFRENSFMESATEVGWSQSFTESGAIEQNCEAP